MMPSASGVAEVKSQRGSMAIEAEFGELQKPTAFGTEYLTYVLWAISPEGAQSIWAKCWWVATTAASSR